MSLEENIRKIVIDELEKRQPNNEVIPLNQYCLTRNISRPTVWRHEKQGLIKLIRLGRKVFVNTNQFITD